MRLGTLASVAKPHGQERAAAEGEAEEEEVVEEEVGVVVAM